MQKERYEQGMVRRFTPLVNADCMELGDHQCSCGGYHSDEFEGAVYLPHSCQEWIIGGRAEVHALIRDLQQLVDD